MDEELRSDLPEHQSVPADAAARVTGLASAGLAAANPASDRPAAGRMPAMYLGHGAPPLVDDPLWTTQLAAWSAALPRPSAILVVSAHWESAPLTIGATDDAAPLVYDFWGFPERYYQVTYPAPGAPGLAERISALLRGTEPVAHAPDRGLDHGAYVPLTVMYPGADIPVLQISMPTLDPGRLLRIGAVLRPLRDEGVLIMGSGFLTHGLPFLRDLRYDAPPPGWSAEFDHWAAEALDRGDVDALAKFRTAPGARYAHPTTEHFAPLFVALGAADGQAPVTTIEGYWLGLAKRSVQVA
ncbi:MAG TPA: class III extradiol ring-cleavage dioxygenase [Streptosporangiaceae bacterium]|nr:class III extradiol ring-cleavage dioxygenase [Streptosporangiaceae bacterium]